MSVLYEKIIELCNEQKINGAKLCADIEIPRSTLTELKAGRAKTLGADKLSKIADYFDVSVDYLLDKTDIKKASPSGDGEEEVLIAMYNRYKDDIDEDALKDIETLLQIRKARAEQKKKETE